MAYSSEHNKMRPVLAQAAALDIATNPDPAALFDLLQSGFNLWCTPEDHPAAWQGVPMFAGAFTKPCAFVATVIWHWDETDAQDPRIIGLNLTTAAYTLRDYEHPERNSYPVGELDVPDYFNRPEDVAWATEKARWLFEQAGVPMPTIAVFKE